MRKNVFLSPNALGAGLLGLAIAASLAGCGTDAESQASPGANTEATVDATRADELEARSQQLAQREAELAAKEQEQEKARQAAEAAQRQREAAANAAAAKKAALARSTSVKNSTPVSANTERPHAAEPMEVPAGTQLAVALSSDLSTKTAKPGDAFEAHLVSDLVIGDRRIAPAGSRLTGMVTEVVSGSNAIGAIPKLSLTFNHLELAEGQRIPISGEFVQLGKSEKGRDTAKIVGGAAAGAIIGHQVKNNDTGTVVGGLLGGAAGAVVAKKTGTEVQLAAGATLTFTLGETIRVAGI